MLLDHLAGRASEVDAINGAIPPAAASVGLEAPLNTAVASLIRAKERGMLAQSAPSRA
jgi:2-dehydropantoate 2-reductase